MILIFVCSFKCLQEEILEVAGKIYKAGMSLLVIDTENKFVSTGFAKEIARVAQGNRQINIRLIYTMLKRAKSMGILRPHEVIYLWHYMADKEEEICC